MHLKKKIIGLTPYSLRVFSTHQNFEASPFVLRLLLLLLAWVVCVEVDHLVLVIGCYPPHTDYDEID